MDAVEYLKEMKRMCDTYYSKDFDFSCNECPFYFYKSKNEIDFESGCLEYMQKHPEKSVETVEQWAKEHPRKTNKDKLVEVFGSEIKQFIKINANACILAFGCRGIGISCKDCQYRYFWNQEYKEPESEVK